MSFLFETIHTLKMSSISTMGASVGLRGCVGGCVGLIRKVVEDDDLDINNKKIKKTQFSQNSPFWIGPER
jgi:hypothetical protein